MKNSIISIAYAAMGTILALAGSPSVALSEEIRELNAILDTHSLVQKELYPKSPSLVTVSFDQKTVSGKDVPLSRLAFMGIQVELTEDKKLSGLRLRAIDYSKKTKTLERDAENSLKSSERLVSFCPLFCGERMVLATGTLGIKTLCAQSSQTKECRFSPEEGGELTLSFLVEYRVFKSNLYSDAKVVLKKNANSGEWELFGRDLDDPQSTLRKISALHIVMNDSSDGVDHIFGLSDQRAFILARTKPVVQKSQTPR